MRPRPMLVVVLVLLAGCGGTSGGTSPTSTETPVATGTDTNSPTQSELPARRTQTATEAATRAPTTIPPPANPWEQPEIVVGINNSVEDREYRPLVREAVEYWNDGGARYADHDVTLVIDADADAPDVVVHVRESIDFCGFTISQSITTGCADLVEPGQSPPDPATVELASGLTDETATETLKHEFGHVMGLDHGERPREVMADRGPVMFISKPDAQTRDYPWRTGRFDVYVDYGEMSREEKEETENQLSHAFGYYSNGANGTVPEGLVFEYVDNESRANIHITVTEDGRAGSQGSTFGQNIDQDRALEYYSYQEIVVRDIPADRRGWHVGYWLGYAFGADTRDELPPPFDDPRSDSRENWWDE